jgi:hypothetical protein
MSGERRGGAVVSIVGLLLLSISCSSGKDAAGSAEVAVMAISASDAASATVTITATDIASPIVVSLVASGGAWGGTIGHIPAGLNRTVALSVRDVGGTELYRGQVTGVTISPGQTASVVIAAQQVSPPPSHNNAAPVIDALVASAVTVAPGDVVSLVVTAHDPNPGDTLVYAWIADGGTFSAPSSSATNWTAPATGGTVHITIEVRDQNNAKAKMSLDVSAVVGHGQGKANITVSLNTWPVVTDVTADPTRVDAGQTLVLNVVATDSDGDVLTYLWSSTCAGTFSSATAHDPSFTLTAVPANNVCTFAVAVQDGKGGGDTGSIVIAAGPPPAVFLPPAVVAIYQSAEKAAAGQAITMSVQAADPNGVALSFAWATSEGSLGQPNTVGGTSGIVWTAPTPFTTSATVQVTITDAIGQAMAQVLAVNPSVPTWQWVSGPILAANAALGQVWAAPGGEVYVTAVRNRVGGQIPESWLYHLKSGVWSTAMHLTDSSLVYEGTVFGTSATDVYVSAYRCPNGNGTCGEGEGPTMWHFDGSSVSQMTIPNIGLSTIQSIRGEAGSLYAAYGTGILHYDGASWSIAASTGSVGFGPLAYLGPNEIYALGCWGYQAWNGATWTNYPGFDFCDVAGIAGFRTGDGSLQLWAEGSNNFANGVRAWQFTESAKGSLTGSWGSKYGTYINDTSASGHGQGTGIWASGPNDFWAVGMYGYYGDSPEGRIWHWDGANWTRQLTSITITSYAQSVWGTSPTDIWVALADGRLLHYTD